MTPVIGADEEIARLQAELDAARAQPAQAGPPVTRVTGGPTHDLYLADGSVVESTGAIPTHYAVGDEVIPVVRVVERS